MNMNFKYSNATLQAFLTQYEKLKHNKNIRMIHA